MTDAISADQIADALGRPRPTAQQRAVIEADLGPALVVAGAGSGKTETMANRVLWLLANGRVRPGEILGLTFTRKAAGELAERIRERVGQLNEAGLVPEHTWDEFDAPSVATYNSFANTLYRDHAVLIGREGDGAVLGPAAAWQLARSIVIDSTDSRLGELGRNVDAITKAVLPLSQSLSENIADPAEVRAMAARFAALAELPPGGKGAYAEVERFAGAVGSLDVLVGLAEEFARAKAHRGFVEYSDQVALALQIVRAVPRVATELRDRYRVVLLDEYQDTSVVQTWLLAELFAGHPVMAVGDPNQSIYGWRGASAANLEEFAAQFGNGSVQHFNLTTSWRNGHHILAAANELVLPLLAETRVRVEPLIASPVANARPLEVAYAETLPDEADAAARWLGAKLAELDPESNPPTAAMLFRARKTQPAFIEALRAHGVPFHVLGISGLMAEPEIADLVSALNVISDPGAGSELVRLLAGSRWRIGVRDLAVLRGLASWLASRDYAQRPLEEDVREKLRASVAEGEGGSIVDALDFIASARPDHSALAQFSTTGVERLRDAGRLFARLRARTTLDLLDLVTLVEQELQLDIEVAANDFRSAGGANREALFDALGGYLAIDESASLRGFLAWLREAEWREDLSPRPEAPEPGTVQLLTIHGAKGLEWDHVVVPRVVQDELPGKPRDGNGWLSFGSLPWQFRGDAAELPELQWENVQTRKEFLDARADFVEQVRQRHLSEERRLAYVAVTRARHCLLLTGSFWAGQTRQRPPSAFLAELEQVGIVGELPTESEHEESPLGEGTEEFTWPMDPLGARRPAVERAAEAVRTADPAGTGPWSDELELLLAEREARLTAGEVVPVPSRVPASRFKDFVTDAASTASSLRRPMPERPYRATRLGTLFHDWVEQRYGMTGTAEQVDSLLTEWEVDDGAAEQDQLAALQATFERSPWAARAPLEVEREIHLVLDGQIIICKIDAVYADGERFEVVDWKTGKAPRSARDLEDKQLQLALYRLAYAKWKGVSPEIIDAVFYYVADDAVVRPERLYDEAELVHLWRAALLK